LKKEKTEQQESALTQLAAPVQPHAQTSGLTRPRIATTGPKGSEAVTSRHLKLENLSGKGFQKNLLNL